MTDDASPAKPLRLTADVRQQLLEQNEGFTARTSYSSRNFSEDRTYVISGGELQVRARGKTSWSDSRYDDLDVADPEATHRFLRQHLDDLDTSQVVVRKVPRPSIPDAIEVDPEVISDVLAEAPDDAVASFETPAALREWWAGLTPAQRALIAAGVVLTVSAGVTVAIYGKRAVKSIRARIQQRKDRSESDT